jgi:hypothetical protein
LQQARVTDTSAAGFPLDLLGLLRGEFDFGAGAHPAASDFTEKIAAAKVAAVMFVLPGTERWQARTGHVLLSVKSCVCANALFMRWAVFFRL